MATGILRRLALTPAAASFCQPALTVETVYLSHVKFVWRCLRSFGVPAQALDDAVAEVFVVVHRRLPEFDGEHARVTTWLYEIAWRVARRHRARAQQEASKHVPLIDGGESAGESPVHLESAACGDLREEVEHADRLDIARRALEALGVEKRDVFVLAFVEQRPAPEIAAILGIPLNTVYSRMRAAKRDFAEAVAHLHATEGASS